MGIFLSGTSHKFLVHHTFFFFLTLKSKLYNRKLIMENILPPFRLLALVHIFLYMDGWIFLVIVTGPYNHIPKQQYSIINFKGKIINNTETYIKSASFSH